MKRRVVITGIGAVTPIGNDAYSSFEAAKMGKCGIGPITYFDTTNFKAKLAAEIKELNIEQYLSKRDCKFNDKFTQYARIAAMQAVSDANLTVEDNERFGVILGSGIGGIETIEGASKTQLERGADRISPFFIPMALINLATGNVAIDHQAKGVAQSVVTACAAASNAIGEAFYKIRDGYQDVVLSGGSEAAITPVAIGGFMNMRALCEKEEVNRASIPFDTERSGFVMGEGAGVLVLEELEHAKRRNAKILAEIVGYGTTCDANHITAPLKEGTQAARAMTLAMQDAKIEAKDITYINAHGTSTPLNDSSETTAIHVAFEDAANKVYVSSIKSMTGHLLGASGAIEAIFSLLMCKEDILLPTINTQNVDEHCQLNHVLNKPLQTKVNYTMSNSLGFGGHNASLIFKKWED